MQRTYRKRNLPPGIFITKKGGQEYVELRLKFDGKLHYEHLGPADEPGILDKAEARRARLKDLSRTGKLNLESAELRLRVNEAVEIFWDLYAHKKRGFRLALNRLKEHLGFRYLDEISRFEVQGWRDWLTEKFHLVDNSVNRHHMVLTNLFNRFYEWKEDKREYQNLQLPVNNPGERCRMPDCSYRDRTRIVTPEEFDRLMLNADTKMRRILLGLVHSLLRQCDLRALTKSKNIDQDRNCFVGLQKKSKRKFEPPITPEMWVIINTATKDLIFPDYPVNFNAPFRHLCRRAEVTGVEPRDFRRSGARRLLKSGQDIAIVQRYLGHGDVRTTQRYVGAQPSELQEAGKVLSSGYRWPTQPVREVALCSNCKKQPADDVGDHGLCVFCFSLTKRKWRPVRFLSDQNEPVPDNPLTATEGQAPNDIAESK